MAFLSDLLLVAGACAAAVYCLVLARRLKALTALDSSMGNAIALLSAQVDGLNASLNAARAAAQGSSAQLAGQAERAEAAGRRLEMLIAALHDLPGQGDGTAAHQSPAEPEVAPLIPGRGARILRRRQVGAVA